MEYICSDCGRTFDEDTIESQNPLTEEDWDYPYYYVKRCSHCDGLIIEARKCDNCGDLFPINDLDDNGLCYNCQEEE